MKRSLPDLAPQGTGNTQGIWVTTYSDMMTNLMMFFLILWAYTQIMQAKKRDVPDPPKIDMVLQQQVRHELEAVGAVAVTSRRVTVTLPSAVLFDAGKADLKPEAQDALAKVAHALALSTAPIVVEGHTDDAPIVFSGWRSNYELSAARAFAVIRFLTAQSLSPDRLSARGYGPHRPVAPNDSEEHKTANRRIEIHLMVPS
jgi:chemotaxis protein MotB